LLPLTCHLNDGVGAPFTDVPVNVIADPRQNGLAEADIVILTGWIGFTVIVIALLVAGFPVAQTAFDVKTQVTISPLFG
jgi:hypothetical protein